MKGMNEMAVKISYGEQAEIISDVLRKEVERLKSLPRDEAKKEARKGLMKVGIVDSDGNFTAPYVALRNQYV